MSLFGNKVEKTLQKCKKKQLELTVRYRDGNHPHPSRVVRVDRDRFLMHGFAETLREDSLRVTVAELGVWFDTRVTHKTHDLRGQLFYYCAFPETLNSLGKEVARYFVYPKAIVSMAESSLEDLLGEESQLDVTKMYAWDISREGLDLVNSKGRKWEIGHVFPHCEITVGKVSSLVSLKIVGMTTRQHGKETFQIISCSFTSPIDNPDELIAICQRIDRL